MFNYLILSYVIVLFFSPRHLAKSHPEHQRAVCIYLIVELQAESKLPVFGQWNALFNSCSDHLKAFVFFHLDSNTNYIHNASIKV